MTDTPLVGLSIVITRPREQAAQLQQRIKQLGGNPVLFPLLEISPPGDSRPLHELLARLGEFDLAIFISPNAVHYGLAAIRAAGGLPSSLRIATVGQGSAKSLHQAGITDVIAPQVGSDSEALLALPQLQKVTGWKIAIFRGDGGRELLGDTLRQRGASVEYAACYCRSKPQHDIGSLLNRQPDALTLSSSEALLHLREMLVTQDSISLLQTPLFVTHARIAAKARELGWQNVIETAGGDDGVISGLIAWSKTHALN